MKMTMTVFVVSGLLGATVTPLAQAQETESVSAPAVQPPTRIRLAEGNPDFPSRDQQPHVRHSSYHAQILAIDLLSVGVLVASAVTESAELAYAGGAVYALGAPSFHLIGRQRSARVVGQSALMRIGFPVVAGVAGYYLDRSTCDDGEWLCGAGGASLGILGGALAAGIIDNVYLAAEYDGDVVDTRPATRALASLGASVAPTRGGASLTVVGAF